MAIQNDNAHLPAAGGGGTPDPASAGGSGGGSRFGPRIDQLLKSALQEQEREQAGFMKVLQASRDALNATRMELDHLRTLVEGRDEALLAKVDIRLDRVASQEVVESLAANSTSASKELATLRKMLGTKLDAVVATLDAVDARTGEALATLAGRVDSLEQGVGDTVLAVTGELAAAGLRDQALAAALDERLATLEQSVEERLATVERTLDARQQEVADAILRALDPVGRIMQLVQGRLARAASDLAVAQGSLLSRLIERDDRLERDRDRVLAELLNEFANGVKSRDRTRIGAQLLDADDERRRRRDLGRVRPASPGPVEYVPQYLPPAGPRLPDPDSDPPSDAPWGATFGRNSEPEDGFDDDPHATAQAAHVERYAGGTRQPPSEWSAHNGASGPTQRPAQGPARVEAEAQGGSTKAARRGRRPVL